MISYTQSLRARAKARILKVVEEHGLGPDDCWPWPGKTNTEGYGKIWDKTAPGLEQLAHRVVYEAFKGAIADGMCLLHATHCNNPSCCNPSHVREGTRGENANDRDQQKRQSHGETHYASFISADLVTKVRSEYADGASTRELADRFSLKRKTIWKIVTNKIRRNG